MIFQGIRGLRANFASIKQKMMARMTEPTKQPTTNGSDQGKMLPPIEVANKKATTAVTTVTAPA